MVAQIVAQARGVVQKPLYGGRLAQIPRQPLLQKRCLNLRPAAFHRAAYLHEQKKIHDHARKQKARRPHDVVGLAAQQIVRDKQQKEDEGQLHKRQKRDTLKPQRPSAPFARSITRLHAYLSDRLHTYLDSRLRTPRTHFAARLLAGSFARPRILRIPRVPHILRVLRPSGALPRSRRRYSIGEEPAAELRQSQHARRHRHAIPDNPRCHIGARIGERVIGTHDLQSGDRYPEKTSGQFADRHADHADAAHADAPHQRTAQKENGNEHRKHHAETASEHLGHNRPQCSNHQGEGHPHNPVGLLRFRRDGPLQKPVVKHLNGHRGAQQHK